MGEVVLAGLDALVREFMLFAAAGFLLIGLDDLLLDLAWAGHRLRHGSTRRSIAALPRPVREGRIAVFVPAWDEAPVIGAMLRTALARIAHTNYRLYLGCYPNDAATIEAVEAVAVQDPRVRMVIAGSPGPTTKADNLNHLWRALRRDDAADGEETRAVVLHDAEQVVPVVQRECAWQLSAACARSCVSTLPRPWATCLAPSGRCWPGVCRSDVTRRTSSGSDRGACGRGCRIA